MQLASAGFQALQLDHQLDQGALAAAANCHTVSLVLTSSSGILSLSGRGKFHVGVSWVHLSGLKGKREQYNGMSLVCNLLLRPGRGIVFVLLSTCKNGRR